MLNDKRTTSCLSRFDSGTYSYLQFLREVSHSVGDYTESLKPRDDNNSSSSSEDEDEDRHAPVPAATISGRRNRQRQPRQQPRTTVAKCASWRHVLALHWCRAGIEHVDSIQDDTMMTKKTLRNLSINQSHNQSQFYIAPKRCPESWPTYSAARSNM